MLLLHVVLERGVGGELSGRLSVHYWGVNGDVDGVNGIPRDDFTHRLALYPQRISVMKMQDDLRSISGSTRV